VLAGEAASERPALVTAWAAEDWSLAESAPEEVTQEGK